MLLTILSFAVKATSEHVKCVFAAIQGAADTSSCYHCTKGVGPGEGTYQVFSVETCDVQVPLEQVALLLGGPPLR